jgi:O-succinylbenzoic acid--CoA ligase
MSDQPENLPLVSSSVKAEDLFLTGTFNLTYGQLTAAMQFTRQKMAEAGLKSGDTVVTVCENSPHLIVFLIAAMAAGMVVAPVNPRLADAEVRGMLQPLAAKIILTGNDAMERNFADVPTQNPAALVNLNLPAARSGFQRLPGLQPVTIVFTSGSSGNARAAVHTFANHYYSALGSGENIPYTRGDRWLLSLPLYHVGGLAILFRTLQAGATVVLPEAAEPLPSSIAGNSVTHVSLVATQLYRLLRQPAFTHHLKAVLLGGGPVDDQMVHSAGEQHLPLFRSYGSTELSSQVATTAPGFPLDGAGRVLPYRELRIAEDGEILLRGATLFAGYLTGHGLDPARDSDGWFHSGDSGRLDSQGNLLVTGRMDNMFISGGENIHPEEIEQILRQVPGVEQAVVVAVPDAEFGQRPVAFVRCLPEVSFNENEWKEKLAGKLARFKIPKWIFTWPEMQEAGLKPNREQLRQLALILVSRQGGA